MWFTSWQSSGIAVHTALISSAFAGMLFGLFMAWYYKRSAKKHKLSDWNEF